eukprot:gnl/Chilomastix_caulleri/1752.p1 GENE.gnl/Chilomastix_caulleri/1752~~gnl/Chilomastix_caulleri/1752.p1  ORF type:complete len:102 (-),score=10.09 gnl/Chilomastix_caulleri/1752:222-527(-)
MACQYWDVSKWGGGPVNGEYDIVLLISTLFWNMCGYDKISAANEEVAEPSKTFPRALFTAVLMVTLTYIIAVAPGLFIESRDWWRHHRRGRRMVCVVASPL